MKRLLSVLLLAIVLAAGAALAQPAALPDDARFDEPVSLSTGAEGEEPAQEEEDQVVAVRGGRDAGVHDAQRWERDDGQQCRGRQRHGRTLFGPQTQCAPFDGSH